MANTDQRNKRRGARGPAGRDGARPGGVPSSGRAGTEVSTGSLTEALSVVESFLSGFEPGRYCGEDAAVLVEWFTRGEHLCATGKALAARRATESDQHRREGSRSAAEWLATKTGESLGQAAGSLRLADQMERHGELGDALRAGELSHTRARQVADVLTVDPTSEDELVEAARDPHETNRQLADRCLRARARARSAEDARAHYQRIHQARYLRHHTDSDGAFRIEGLFTPDAGAKLLAALKPTRTVIFDEARRLGLRERPDAYEADALVALLTGERPPALVANGGTDHSHPASTDPAGTGPAGTGPASTRTADASTGPASTGPADNDVSTGPASSRRADANCPPTGFPPPASVHLRVDLAALRRGTIEDGECCEIPGIGPVPLETARSVLGDAVLHLVITKGSDISSVTHLGRTIRAPLKRALIERDQTCVVPGCDVREGLEIDHRIIPVVENGETALWNLARLCRHHHYLRHHQGFRLEGGPGGWQWLPPEKPPPRDRDHTGSDDDDDRLFQLE